MSTLISPEFTIAMLAAQLNAPAGTDVTTFNIADGTHPEMLKKSLPVQQTINNIAQLIQAAGGTDKLAAIYASVAAAFGKSLAVAAATPGAAPFISSTGTVNAAAVASFVSALPAVVALNIPAVTLTAAVASIAAEAQQFVSASDAAIGDLTKDLQSTTKPPVYTAPAPAPAPGPAETTNFVSLASDSLIIDGQSLTLATLAQGATVTGLTDVGFSLNVTGTPAADVTASVAIELAEQGGTGRLFQFMIDKVSMKLTAGQLAVTLADGAVVYVHGISDNHSEVSLTLTDLSFNPVNAGSNTFTLNYANMVNKVLGSGDSNFNGTARTFLDMKGTFLVRVILSNVNLRHADGSAISTQSITLPNAPAAVVGDGVSGLIVLN